MRNLDLRIQEEREKACGLRVGDKLQIDEGFAGGRVVRITAIREKPDNVFFKYHGNTHCIYGFENAQRMRALYLKSHPETLITE